MQPQVVFADDARTGMRVEFDELLEVLGCETEEVVSGAQSILCLMCERGKPWYRAVSRAA